MNLDYVLKHFLVSYDAVLACLFNYLSSTCATLVGGDDQKSGVLVPDSLFSLCRERETLTKT